MGGDGQGRGPARGRRRHRRARGRGVTEARCDLDWGWRGAREAAARRDVVVIVDVLRFSSAVATAAAHGVSVRPLRYAPGIAGTHRLSPRSFVAEKPGSLVDLPSPNGATATLNAAAAPAVFAAALVNAAAASRAVRRVVEETGAGVTVIACGERWPEPSEDGVLRFAIEDYAGAGAVLSALGRPLTPEAEVCAAAFLGSRGSIERLLLESVSGRELIAAGREDDVRDCARLDVYEAVPVLRDGVYEPLRGLPAAQA